MTTDTLDKDAEGASWARALAAALGADVPGSDASEQSTGSSVGTAGERHELVARASKRLIPIGEETARGWLPHFATVGFCVG